ncbi:MAG: hypothetical protein H7144_06360 [Burkholderiales bacterium]|nr:hypothetical protein [Phycisphaerae bacterium]
MDMTQINPLAGAVSQSPQAARLLAADRDAQVRKTTAGQKSTGFSEQLADEFVESADAIAALGQETKQQNFKQKKRRKPTPLPDQPATEVPHIDLRG